MRNYIYKQRINLGSFPKDIAREISKQFSRLKRLRNSNNKKEDFDIILRSRTYGRYDSQNLGRTNRFDRARPIREATKLAVYLCLKGERRL